MGTWESKSCQRSLLHPLDSKHWVELQPQEVQTTFTQPSRWLYMFRHQQVPCSWEHGKVLWSGKVREKEIELQSLKLSLKVRSQMRTEGFQGHKVQEKRYSDWGERIVAQAKKTNRRDTGRGKHAVELQMSAEVERERGESQRRILGRNSKSFMGKGGKEIAAWTLMVSNYFYCPHSPSRSVQSGLLEVVKKKVLPWPFLSKGDELTG